jgi:hypothetical protein
MEKLKKLTKKQYIITMIVIVLIIALMITIKNIPTKIYNDTTSGSITLTELKNSGNSGEDILISQESEKLLISAYNIDSSKKIYVYVDGHKKDSFNPKSNKIMSIKLSKKQRTPESHVVQLIQFGSKEPLYCGTAYYEVKEQKVESEE